MNDKELVSRMQHGDMQAFDELYERYKDDAYRLACLITGSRTDGEDLAQEAFVTCAQSIKSLRDGSKFRPWLLRTLSRAAWKYCRKARRETPVSEFFDENTGESALSSVLRTEEQRRLYAALRTLDEVGDVHDAVHVLMRHPQRQHRTNQQRRTRAEQHK